VRVQPKQLLTENGFAKFGEAFVERLVRQEFRELADVLTWKPKERLFLVTCIKDIESPWTACISTDGLESLQSSNEALLDLFEARVHNAAATMREGLARMEAV
jgi:hypothetical protein